jgi:hypothetical protein
MGGMPTWEYAEVFWNSAHTKFTWYGPAGTAKGYKGNGLQVLQDASRDGWEVVGYSAAPGNASDYALHESRCLLRRLLP